MSKARKYAENTIIGFGAYYLMVYGLLFYPALVVGMKITKDTNPDMPICPEFYGIIFFLITVKMLMLMFYNKLWQFLVPIYLFCLWPFIQIVQWIYNSASDEPFPGFDWIPFFFN